MVGTNDYTNENQKFYKSTVQAILRGGVDFATKVGSLCACFIDMWPPTKTQVENVLNNILNLRGQTIDVSDQAVLTLRDLGLHNE